MYTFYSDGFFGYGEPGDFKYFSFWHFLPIFLLIIAIIYTYKKQDNIRKWKHEERFRYIFAFIMMIVEMSFFWRLLYVGDELGNYSLLVKLPLQVCQWSLIASIFMLMSKNKQLFNICFYVCLIFGTSALLTPTVIIRTGPTYYRYYQFFLEHEMPIYAVFYMIFIHGFRPTYKSMYYILGILILLALFCVYVNNHIDGANYMYLAGYKEGVDAGDNIINYLPKNQYLRILSLLAIVVPLFNILYFVFTKIFKKIDKKENMTA